MKAIQINQFGGQEKITCQDIKTPHEGNGEVLIRVKAVKNQCWDGAAFGTSAGGP